MPLNNDSGNSLMTLMALKNKVGSSGNISPTVHGSDADLYDMIPEEALFEAQAERPGVSRESLRNSGVSALRRMFGEVDAKANAAAYPRQVAGEYATRAAQIRAAGQVEAARANAEAQAARQRQSAADAMERTRMIQDSVGARQEQTQQSIADRAAATQQGQSARAGAKNFVSQAGQIEKAAQDMFDPFGLLGRRKAEMARAAALRQQAVDLLGTDTGEDEGEEITPEEMALILQHRQAQGR